MIVSSSRFFFQGGKIPIHYYRRNGDKNETVLFLSKTSNIGKKLSGIEYEIMKEAVNDSIAKIYTVYHATAENKS